MILDAYKLSTAIFQIQFPTAYVLWDTAGTIASRLASIWPDLELVEGRPDQQILKGRGVQLQSTLKQCNVTLRGENSLDQQRTSQLTKTFEVWRQVLQLCTLTRVSTRLIYSRAFPSLDEANIALLELGLVHWPLGKVFDQPQKSEKNSFDLQFKFEDDVSFSFLRFHSEKLEFKADLDPDFVKEHEIRSIRCRLHIDFDRGHLGEVAADKFRMEDWIKGVQHILRRDIEKVVRA